jgi:peptidoglycan-N-acetylglucosamine deacetylase
MPTSEKVIYLTFDDGPVPGPTEFVLETLANYRAKASFFCIGDNIRKHPEVFTKIINDGHAIGNHTFNHLKGWSTPVKDYVDNTELCNTQINSILQPPASNIQLQSVSLHPKLFRPPYGRITRSQIKALSHYKVVMWDVLSYDYSQTRSVESCLRGTIRVTRPGSIVVFHDSYKAEKKMQYTLPRFMDHFLQQGYLFSAIEKL